MKKILSLRYFMPLLIVIILSIFLWQGLRLHPNLLPSALIDKPLPAFSMTTVENEQAVVTEQDFAGEPFLLNVWATWCAACALEHPFLVQLAGAERIKIVGLDYKDDRRSALAWLQQHGNPYQVTLYDGSGRGAIDWGIYAIPETFLIDHKGKIRFRHVGPVNSTVWQQQLLPIVEKIERERQA